MFARERKKLYLGGFIPFAINFIIQILPVKTINFSAETLLQRLPNKKALLSTQKRIKKTSGSHRNLFLYINLSKNQKLLKQYQKLVEFPRWKNSVTQL